jgi:endonuclease YncB( thermonuclease family)
MPGAALLLCLVVGISDGDTIKARCDQRAGQPAQNLTIRLAEIDAPEKRQPFGARSREHLARLCFKQIAEVRPSGRDRYGRTVARVACGGADASEEQARAGMAWAFVKYLTDPGIRELEAEARGAGRGLWADSHPVAPWDWRAAQHRG